MIQDLERRSINIHIFGRQFPIRVTDEEAAVVKEAASVINSKIRTFRADYTHQDDLDIALMACLDIMTEFLRLQSSQEQETNQMMNALSRLETELDQTLNPQSASS